MGGGSGETWLLGCHLITELMHVNLNIFEMKRPRKKESNEMRKVSCHGPSRLTRKNIGGVSGSADREQKEERNGR